jgi:hypothetical protein
MKLEEYVTEKSLYSLSDRHNTENPSRAAISPDADRRYQQPQRRYLLQPQL